MFDNWDISRINCHQMNVNGLNWWEVNIRSDNGAISHYLNQCLCRSRMLSLCHNESIGVAYWCHSGGYLWRISKGTLETAHKIFYPSGILCNIRLKFETHHNLNLANSRLSKTYFAVVWSFWNFAQWTAVILPYSVEHFKTIIQLKRVLWTNGVSRDLICSYIILIWYLFYIFRTEKESAEQRQ